jgi:hypothetical protein
MMRKPRYNDIFAGHDEGEALAEHANVLWAMYKADLDARGLWSATRAKMMDRLVRYHVEHDHYHPIVVAEGPVVAGPNGGDMVNMKWTMVQKLADRIDKLEKALTLTPESVGAKAEAPKKGEKMTSAERWKANRAASH